MNIAYPISLAAAVLMTGCATGVNLTKAQLPSLSLELMEVQEEYLNACQPRPTGNGIRGWLVTPELQGRLSLIIDTWDDCVHGQADAQRALSRGHLRLLAFGSLNDYEKTYVELLHRNFGVEFVAVRRPVTDSHRRLYVYGYNSTVANRLEVEHGFNTFVGLIEDAVRQHTTDKFNYYSPFFIPWRFDDDAHIIEFRRSAAEYFNDYKRSDITLVRVELIGPDDAGVREYAHSPLSPFGPLQARRRLDKDEDAR